MPSRFGRIPAVVALFLAALNLRPAINSIGPLLDTLRPELAMSAPVASLLTALPVLCMGLGAPLAVRLSRRFGIERTVLGALALVGLGTLARLWALTAPTLVGTAVVAGIGIAVMGPLLSGYIKQQFHDRVPAMISLFTVAISLGAALASGLTAPLQRLLGGNAPALAAWSVLALLSLPAWWAWAAPNRTAASAPEAAPLAMPSSGMPLGDPLAWLLTASFGLMAFVFYAMTAWLPPIVRDLGYDRAFAATAFTVFAFIQIPTSLAMPILLRRWPGRLGWLVAMAAFELVGLTMLLTGTAPLAAAAIIGIGTGGLFPLNLLLPIDVTRHGHEAAAWTAMAQALGYIFGAIGPVMVGWVHDRSGGFQGPLLAIAASVVVMIGVHVAIALRRRDAVASLGPCPEGLK